MSHEQTISLTPHYAGRYHEGGESTDSLLHCQVTVDKATDAGFMLAEEMGASSSRQVATISELLTGLVEAGDREARQERDEPSPTLGLNSDESIRLQHRLNGLATSTFSSLVTQTEPSRSTRQTRLTRPEDSVAVDSAKTCASFDTIATIRP
ncbi:unnamed protein product, partial [Protopolystoma xenopodis]